MNLGQGPLHYHLMTIPDLLESEYDHYDIDANPPYIRTEPVLSGEEVDGYSIEHWVERELEVSMTDSPIRNREVILSGLDRKDGLDWERILSIRMESREMDAEQEVFVYGFTLDLQFIMADYDELDSDRQGGTGIWEYRTT